MNRSISVRWILAVIPCVFALSVSLQTAAASKKGSNIAAQKTQQKKAPPSADVTITPEDVARWCKNNPGDCNVQSPDNYPTLTQREMGCIDTLGDNNGTTTADEYEQYNAQCP